ncbi:MAG: extracellular solute-binding protein [Alphaproteobacteria bacterium]|nr:extracellular solute-binding protein [Alphaproteobacteria bacterium]
MATGVSTARAEDPPAVQAAASEQRETLKALIEAAKKEGVVNYWDVVIQPETNELLTKDFRKRYGLPSSFGVKYTLSITTNLITRVEQETAAGNVTIDVASIASPPWITGLIKAGHVMKYDSPEHKAYQLTFDAGLGKAGYFAFNGAYTFIPMWSTEHEKKFAGTSYKDVLDAVPAGRISLNDSTKSATALLTCIGLRQVLDLDYFKALAKMKPSFIVRSEATAERLAAGEDLMAFGGMPTRAYQYNDKGASLKIMWPSEGLVLLGQGSFILAKAPHPNAAKLWLDYMLSNAGQQILSKHEALVSGRAGFKSPLPDYAPPIDQLKLIKMDWGAITTDDLNKARAEWLSVFNP